VVRQHAQPPRASPGGVARRPAANGSLRDLLASCFEVSLTPALLNHAGGVEPASLRSFDAIHLASVLVLGDELESFVAYDDRLLAAAQALQLPARSPR